MKKIFSNIFYVLGFVLLTLVFGLLLQMYCNVLWGWIASAVLIAAYAVIRTKYLTGKKWWKKTLAFLGVIILFAGVYKLSLPPVKQIYATKENGSLHTSNHTRQGEDAFLKVGEDTSLFTDVVSVQEGDLVGVYTEDQKVKVYAGIPYAKAPVGDLRWKETVPAESWDGVRVCDTFQPMSMQNYDAAWYTFGSNLIGFHNIQLTTEDDFVPARSEDSLYVNVWTPADAKPGDDLPVVVYYHGGSLTTGQSYHKDYNGESFAENGVVYVTVSYRLGVFGYLATEDLAQESKNATTGNYGLLDQVQALKWVNANIETFGGDVDNITIAGESAGSSSVGALCVSPLAKGLFKRAIAESSGICGVEPYHTFRSYDKALETGANILKEFNCDSMDELRKLSAEEILTTEYRNSAMTVDGYAITEQPYLTYEKGENNEEALLNGYNADEATAFTMFSSKPGLNNYEEFLSEAVGEDYSSDMTKVLPASTDDEAAANYNRLMGVAWFGYSHYAWSNLLAAENKAAYYYYFKKNNGSIGSWHSGEIPYAYGNLDGNPKAYDDTDQNLSRTMMAYWINFAKTGNPNGDGLPQWNPYEENSDELMILSDSVGMGKNADYDIMKLIEKYQNSLK